MRWTLFTFLLFGLAINSKAQTIVAAPNSMYLVYNNTNNYFYINIPGTEKSTTDIDNMYIVDGQMLQVLSVKKSLFLPDSLATAKPSEILAKYLAYEEEYLKASFGDSTNISKEAGRLPNGREYLFWTVNLPQQSPSDSDTLGTGATAISQLYIATEIGQLILAISAPYFSDDGTTFDKIKNLLIEIIRSVTISPVRIDIFELDQKVNSSIR